MMLLEPPDLRRDDSVNQFSHANDQSHEHAFLDLLCLSMSPGRLSEEKCRFLNLAVYV